MFKDIIYHKANKVAQITINRPKVHNAFRYETLLELISAFQDANEDPMVRVITLTGSGDEAFCSGGDVDLEAGMNPNKGRKWFSCGMRLAAEIRNNGKPVIAVVRGYCVGGGNELNLLCDLTISADNGKFGQAGPRVGSVPVWGGTQLLPRLVGDKIAKEIVFLCKVYTADEALKLGWINKVVPLNKLQSEVDIWCKELIAKSPTALRIAKASLNFESDALYPSYIHGGEILNLMHGTAEFKEGMEAFLEKRKPKFE